MVLRKNFNYLIVLTNRLGEHVWYFGRTASLWGRMFSMLWWVPKLFPKWSDYDALRESAMKYYDCIKVRFCADYGF